MLGRLDSKLFEIGVSRWVQNICTAAESQSQSSKMVVNAIDEISRMTGEIVEQTGNLNQSLAHLVEIDEFSSIENGCVSCCGAVINSDTV